VAQTDPLKIYISVPEANSRAIHPGVKATIHVAAYPERDFHGEVVRNAGALDISSRTLRTEVDVPNKDAALLPGAYADVHLELTDDKPTILVPANTLIVNSAGTQVALLEPLPGGDKDLYKVHLLPVRVGRDFGTEVEVQRNDQSVYNVKEGDRLITNPPADLVDGAEVIAKPKPVSNATAPMPALGPGPEPRRS
jgi:multidrug efflux pump subunit AcrA (membrane-fusion protein)